MLQDTVTETVESAPTATSTPPSTTSDHQSAAAAAVFDSSEPLPVPVPASLPPPSSYQQQQLEDPPWMPTTPASTSSDIPVTVPVIAPVSMDDVMPTVTSQADLQHHQQLRSVVLAPPTPQNLDAGGRLIYFDTSGGVVGTSGGGENDAVSDELMLELQNQQHQLMMNDAAAGALATTEAECCLNPQQMQLQQHNFSPEFVVQNHQFDDSSSARNAKGTNPTNNIDIAHISILVCTI